jgi:MFS family permease
LIIIFVFYVAARMAAGPAGLAFFDIVAKTVPPRRRGRLFAWRLFLGGILGLGGGWVVNTVLNHPPLPFPRGHALLFLLYTVVFMPACLAFIAIREPPGIAASERPALREQLRRAKQILLEDGVYRRFLIIKVIMALAGTALPFYGVYAKNMLDAPEGMVGIYVTTRIAAQLLFNLPWGWLSDRRGNRLALRLQIIVTGITLLSALALVGFVALSDPQGAWLPYLALPLFFLDGALLPTYILTGNNFLLELVPEAKRSLYLGLNNTLMGIVILISGFGGLVVDLLGFGGLFAASLALCLVGFTLTGKLPEPRENERMYE